ncbi:hypothetical protein JOM56_014930 [Amanita muscaria]
MSSSDPRSVNPLLTMDERNDVRRSIAGAKAERNDVRLSIAKAEAKLQRLLDHRKKITKNISQLKKTLVIHRILPREIIGYIFSILRAEKICIPRRQYYWTLSPSQITVSHVCCKWREIALATPVLWNNVEITQPGCQEWVQVAIELLFNRAGTRGVNLALNMERISSNKMGEIFYDIVLPLHVKKLHLALPGLPLSALENLLQKSADIIANIDEIALSFATLVPSASNSNQVSITPHFLGKIRSVTVLDVYSQRSPQHLDLLPWAQMRHLCCTIPFTLFIISDILRQSPLLDVCGIRVEQDDEAEPTTVLTLPQLRIFHIVICNNGPQRDKDKVLWSFKCPNLTDFRLEIPDWTPETYKIIENQYNLHQLLRFDTSNYPYPISKLLFDAPMLQELILVEKVFMDEKALQGIASGKLGRCLTSLGFQGNFNEKSVLDMVASRQRYVKQVVEASRSWQDQQISGIKWIHLLLDDGVKDNDLLKELQGKRDELGELGVILYDSIIETMASHPLLLFAE